MPSDDEIRSILKQPGVSYWLREALTAALDRDPVDAANDAELLAIVLRQRLEKMQTEVQAAIEAVELINRISRT